MSDCWWDPVSALARASEAVAMAERHPSDVRLRAGWRALCVCASAGSDRGAMDALHDRLAAVEGRYR